jgi:hypothetical protein
MRRCSEKEASQMDKRVVFAILIAAPLSGCNGASGGVSGYEVNRNASNESNSPTMQTVFVNCSSGKKVLGGGAVIGYQSGNSFPTDPNGILMESEPNGGQNGWQASGVDLNTNDSWAVIAYAICANVQ